MFPVHGFKYRWFNFCLEFFHLNFSDIKRHERFQKLYVYEDQNESEKLRIDETSSGEEKKYV